MSSIFHHSQKIEIVGQTVSLSGQANSLPYGLDKTITVPYSGVVTFSDVLYSPELQGFRAVTNAGGEITLMQYSRYVSVGPVGLDWT